VFNDLKRSLKSNESISSYWAIRLSHLAIGPVLIIVGVEPEYWSVIRSLSGWGPKEELNASITAESEITDFLRLLKLIWWLDSSMIAVTAGSEVVDFCYGLKYYPASFGLAMPHWFSLNKFLLRWWHVAFWSLNAHQF
jgi:hypothetical protein